MKNGALILLICAIISSCASTRKDINRGDYELAIQKSLKHVRNSHKVDKNAPLLEEAYNKAYNRDMDRINLLRKEGQPENVLDVLDKMILIRQRYSWVSPILPLHIAKASRDAVFPTVSDDDYIKAKRDACDYLYARAKSLLQTGNRQDARTAWNKLNYLTDLNPSYSGDINNLKSQALEQGISYVLVKMRLRGVDVLLPESFERDLLNIRVDDLNSQWVVYTTRPDKYPHYAYNAYVNITGVNVTPEHVNTVQRTETKQVADGFDTKKDSTGKEVKVPHMKTIAAQVNETQMNKVAHVSGTVEYYNLETQQSMVTYPVAADAIFNYSYANVNGDLNAICDATRKMMNNGPATFPTTLQLLAQAAGTLKPIVRDVLANHRDMFR